MSFAVPVFRPTLSTPNNRNTRTRTYPTAPTHNVRARQFAPSGLPEAHEPGRNAIETAPTLYLLPRQDLNEYDQIEIDGVRYEVNGKPDTWANRRSGRRHGIAVRLKGVSG